MKSKLLLIMIAMSIGLSASEFSQAKKDCDNNIGSSCYSLAHMYADDHDNNRALETFKKGCELNHTKSCVGAGAVASEMGDNQQIEKYYKEACDKGSNLGCEFLGNHYFKQGSYKKAISPLKKVCFSSSMEEQRTCQKLADISKELSDDDLAMSIMQNCISKEPSSLGVIRIKESFCATELNLNIYDKKRNNSSSLYPLLFTR